MANKFRGEAELNFTREPEGGGEEVQCKFKLVFDANAFCEIEDMNDGMGLPEFLEALSDPKKMSFKKLRTFVLGGLSRHHPELTLADAGDIISDAGMEEVLKSLQAAVASAMPKKGGRSGEAKPKK